MTELLAPAGSMEALKAAIANGCNAIYLGMQKFGARAYSSNFDMDSLKEAVAYAHLRDVKIFVTMNTIIFESEIQEMQDQMQALNALGVDGIIVQDLAALDYLVNHFDDLEAHISTQMGIDDLEGTLLLKDLGAERVVLAREVAIDKVKAIQKAAKLPIEIFVHGALCISYSGNCLMSGLIGYRSGNRGRCVGSCRKAYDLIDMSTGLTLSNSYILSPKDLNTIDYIEDLRDVDSLKIEGRMKEPAYVANVVSKYRKALDQSISQEDKEDLSKTFNRTFTKGYLFNEDKKDIINVARPNNFGFEVGKITRVLKDKYEISLTKPLNQNDIIRISHNNEDIVLSVVKLYDKEGNLVKRADKVCYIKIKDKLTKGDVVYITKDQAYYKTLEASMDGEFMRYNLDINVYAHPGKKLVIHAEGLGFTYIYESQEDLSEAINNPTTTDQVIKQFSRLNDTIFSLNHVAFDHDNVFIPAKVLNGARREIVEGLYDLKLKSYQNRLLEPQQKQAISFEPQGPYLTAQVHNQDQYDACVKAGIKEVYFKNIIRRNQNDYKDHEGQLLLGGFGGVYRYKDSNDFVTDYSLNVVNATSCYTLHKLGARRITLSYELNKKQIDDLVSTYYSDHQGYPALEMVVYGRAPLMFTKYCPMKTMDQCSVCKTKNYEIRDEHGSFPILSHEDCTTTILNGKTLNLLDELNNIKGVEAFRLNFTLESKEEVEDIIKKARGKLEGRLKESVFDSETQTRGHYNKEIM